MKRVVITGGSGFVGANLARAMRAAGQEVHLLLRADHQNWRLEGLDSYQHMVDLSDADAVSGLMRELSPQFCFNLAAYGAYSYQLGLAQMTQVNVLNAATILEAAQESGVEAFVQAGSSSEYGFQDVPPTESTCAVPHCDCAVTKLAATNLCVSRAQAEQLPVRVLRLYSVYGPWETATRLMPTLAAKALAGELPPMADPRTARDFVYVEDVCAAFIAATNPALEPGAIFNVGSGLETTLATLVNTVRRLADLNAEPVWAAYPNRCWDTSNWCAETTRAKEVLGWVAETSVAEGFAKTMAWLEEGR